VASELVPWATAFALFVQRTRSPRRWTTSRTMTRRAALAQREPGPIRAHPDAWLGSAGYAVVLVRRRLRRTRSSGLRLVFVGELVSGLTRSGELWRVVTRLRCTLIRPPAHKFRLGMLFGYLGGPIARAGDRLGEHSRGGCTWEFFLTRCSCRQPSCNRRIDCSIRDAWSSCRVLCDGARRSHAGPIGGRH